MALQSFPELEGPISAVQADKSFLLTDIPWISAVLGIGIRVTIDTETYKSMVENGETSLPEDSLFGCEFGRPLGAHLRFKWERAVGENRRFGHFDLLIPTTIQATAIFLPRDVFWIHVCDFAGMGMFFKVRLRIF